MAMFVIRHYVDHITKHYTFLKYHHGIILLDRLTLPSTTYVKIKIHPSLIT